MSPVMTMRSAFIASTASTTDLTNSSGTNGPKCRSLKLCDCQIRKRVGQLSQRQLNVIDFQPARLKQSRRNRIRRPGPRWMSTETAGA